MEAHAENQFFMVPPYGHILKVASLRLDPAALLGIEPERFAVISAALRGFQLVDASGFPTEFGANVSKLPLDIPFGSFLLSIASKYKQRKPATLNEATLLAAIVFIALINTGNPSKLLWVKKDVLKDPVARAAHHEKHYAEFKGKDDLESNVKIFFAALSLADGVNNAWCRDHALNDTLVRAVCGTTRTLVMQCFGCDKKIAPQVIKAHAARIDAVNFKLLRFLIHMHFKANKLTTPQFEQRREGEGLTVTYENAAKARWIIDTKRSMCEMSPEAPLKNIISMCLFTCQSRGSGANVRLASSIVAPA